MVQSRPITALPEPFAGPPTDWAVPDSTGLYVRASIVEQLPDPLSPLFADLVDGSVTRSLQALLGEVLGTDVVRDGDVALPTINGYAYHHYRRSAMWRILRQIPRALPLLVGRGAGSGVRRWRGHSHPRYARIVRDQESGAALGERTATELLTGVRELLDAGTEYYTSVQTIIPLAASAELAFTAFYDRAVRRTGDPGATTFLLGFDSMPIRTEKSLYDLATWVRGHGELAALLATTPSDRLVEMLRTPDPPTGVDGPLWRRWCRRFQAHLDRFGHAVYNLDFCTAVPADDPAPLLDTLRFYLRDGGADPHERQRRSAPGDDDARGARPARSAAAGGLRPAAGLGAEHRTGAGGRPRRHDRAAAHGLAGAAPGHPAAATARDGVVHPARSRHAGRVATPDR